MVEPRRLWSGLSISRTLWKRSRSTTTPSQVDWLTYPILDITETPEKIDFALINRPELPASGAGEPSIRPSRRPSPMRSSAPRCADQAAPLRRSG
jgi:hypothetical protein